MRHELLTEIIIDAPHEEVWAVLTDLEAFADWNPFMPTASGKVAVGESLVVGIQPPGRRVSTMRPRVTEVEADRVLEWLGHAGVRGLFDGRHRYELEPHGEGTRFIHREFFSGLLVRPARRWLERTVRPGFEAMNTALAERVTSGSATR